MKKLLVLALVLSMATMASATLQLQVGADTAATDVTITTVPSGSITLGIWTDAQILPGVGEGYWALSAMTSGATISGGASMFPNDGGIFIYDDAVGAGVGVPAGENGPYGAVVLAVLSSIAANAQIYSGIVLHCEGAGDVTVTLWANADSTPVAVDQVIVHQVPEPMTMGLLGLGGLFLRRRK